MSYLDWLKSKKEVERYLDSQKEREVDRQIDRGRES